MLNSGFTMIPNEFLDRIADGLSAAELRVMLYIYRHTVGYHKLRDKISYSQFTSGVARKDGTRLDNGAGVSRRSLVDALVSLEDKKLIKRIGKRGSTCQVMLTDKACGNVDKHFIDSREKVQKAQPVAVNPVQGLHSTKESFLQDKITTTSLLPMPASTQPNPTINLEMEIEQMHLVNAIVKKIPAMPKQQATNLVKQAYSQRTQAAVWLYALLEYVLSSNSIKSPVAAFTAFVQRSITPNPVAKQGDRQLTHRAIIDYSKYLPGGRCYTGAVAGVSV